MTVPQIFKLFLLEQQIFPPEQNQGRLLCAVCLACETCKQNSWEHSLNTTGRCTYCQNHSLPLLTIVSNATISIRTQIPLEDTDFVSFGYISRSDIAGSFGCSVGDFEETQHFFHSGCTMYIPTNNKGSLFSLSLLTFFIPFFFSIIILMGMR